VSRYQKGKTNLDLTEARDSEWQWHQPGCMQVCTSLQTDNHASSPTTQFFTGQMPFLPPNQQRQSTEGLKYVTVVNNLKPLSMLVICHLVADPHHSHFPPLNVLAEMNVGQFSNFPQNLNSPSSKHCLFRLCQTWKMLSPEFVNLTKSLTSFAALDSHCHIPAVSLTISLTS